MIIIEFWKKGLISRFFKKDKKEKDKCDTCIVKPTCDKEANNFVCFGEKIPCDRCSGSMTRLTYYFSFFNNREEICANCKISEDNLKKMLKKANPPMNPDDYKDCGYIPMVIL